MNITEAALVRIITDALRDAREINTVQADPAAIAIVEDTLWDMAKSVSDEVWDTQSEEAPPMPQEWLDAIKGK